MNTFLPLNHFILVMGILSTFLIGDNSKKDIKKPNLLFIFPDQFRAQAMGICVVSAIPAYSFAVVIQ